MRYAQVKVATAPAGRRQRNEASEQRTARLRASAPELRAIRTWVRSGLVNATVSMLAVQVVEAMRTAPGATNLLA